MTAAAPAFRLERRPAPARALQRLARRQLQHALDCLERGGASGIHEARKACKRLRALLRLMRPALGARYRSENTRVRDAGRALSALREAEALRATARSLALRLPAPRATAGRTVESRAIRDAARLLRTQARAIERWPASAPDREALRRALGEGYRRARRAGRQARRDVDAATLHEWRKQVKHHRYQCEACTPLWPRLRARVGPLDELAEGLGRHHDLEMLALRLPKPPQPLRAEQRRLAARALRAGAGLFDARTREWRARELAS